MIKLDLVHKPPESGKGILIHSTLAASHKAEVFQQSLEKSNSNSLWFWKHE